VATGVSDCEKCGQEHLTKHGHPACTGHSLGRLRPEIAGKACRNPPNRGQEKCGKHGGNSPQALTAAQQRITEQKAAKIMARFAGPINTSPTQALLDSVRWAAGYVAFLREQVERVTNDADEADDLVWGITKETEGDVAVGFGASASLEKAEGVVREAKPNAWLPLLGTWQDRLTKLCSEAIKAGIEERRVRLAEQQGALVADVIRGILGELALTPDQAAKVSEVVPRHLRLLIGGAA
jgi:hypothetical protein